MKNKLTITLKAGFYYPHMAHLHEDICCVDIECAIPEGSTKEERQHALYAAMEKRFGARYLEHLKHLSGIRMVDYKNGEMQRWLELDNDCNIIVLHHKKVGTKDQWDEILSK